MRGLPLFRGVEPAFGGLDEISAKFFHGVTAGAASRKFRNGCGIAAVTLGKNLGYIFLAIGDEGEADRIGKEPPRVLAKFGKGLAAGGSFGVETGEGRSFGAIGAAGQLAHGGGSDGGSHAKVKGVERSGTMIGDDDADHAGIAG